MQAAHEHVDGLPTQRGAEHLNADDAVVAPLEQRCGERIEFEGAFAGHGAAVAVSVENSQR